MHLWVSPLEVRLLVPWSFLELLFLGFLFLIFPKYLLFGRLDSSFLGSLWVSLSYSSFIVESWCRNRTFHWVVSVLLFFKNFDFVWARSRLSQSHPPSEFWVASEDQRVDSLVSGRIHSTKPSGRRTINQRKPKIKFNLKSPPREHDLRTQNKSKLTTFFFRRQPVILFPDSKGNYFASHDFPAWPVC